MGQACTDLHICTDDGTYGYHGFVTGKLEELIQSGVKFDHVFAIGPLMMMKFACKLTKQYEIPTTVSMNPIMIDGLPPHRGRRGEVRLRGRPRLRRPPGGLRRGDRPERYVQRF